MGKLVPAIAALALVAFAACVTCAHLGLIAPIMPFDLPPLGEVAAARVRGLGYLAAEFAVLGPAGPLYSRIARAAYAGFLAASAQLAKLKAGSMDPFTLASIVATAFVSGARGAMSTPTLALLAVVIYTAVNTRRASWLRARRAAANAATRAVRQEGIRRLCALASKAKRPRWASDEAKPEGDFENVEWFNQFLSTLWPYIAQAMKATVRRVIEPKLDAQRPKGINTMTFDAFNLGTIPPLIEQVGLIPPDEADELQIQVKFTWKGNPKIVFKVAGPMIYGGTSPLKIDIGELAISATAKITLSHLMGEAPCVGGVQITLTEDPYVSYRIAVKAAPGMPSVNLSSIPGLTGAVQGAITVAFREKVVFPKSINSVIVKKHTPWTVRAIEDAIQISPVGRLKLTVRGASGLKNMEVMGTSDPYANIALGSRKYPPLPADCLYRTKTIDNNLHPTWDETFELDVCSTELQCLWVRIYDDDGQYGTDDLMGSVVLPLSGLPTDGTTVRGSYPLKKDKELQTGGKGKKTGSGRGELFLELTYTPITEPEDETRKKVDQMRKESGAKHRATAEAAYGFQRQICKLLGIKVADADGRALNALLASDDGSLGYLSDRRLRQLVNTLPPRMDLGHGIPLWAAFPGFEGMRSFNQIFLTIWPYAATAVRRDVDTLNAQVLRKKLPPFMYAKVIADLGAIPPTFESVRAFKSDGDEICLEFHLKIAGDMRFGASFGARFMPLCGARVQVAELTLAAIVRVKLQPLVPRIPIVAGTAVSFVGDPLIDAAIRLKLPLMPGLDLGCLPGVDVVKNVVLKEVVPKMYRYPSWLYSPVLDFDHPAVRQLTRGSSKEDGQHVVTVKVRRARNLDATDGWYSDPFAVVVMAGEADYESRAKRTAVKKRTLKPEWNQTFSFSGAADAGALMIAVFDSDAKPTVVKAIDPARLRRKMTPVTRQHLKSLPHAERFHMRADDIPFNGTVAKKAKEAAEKNAIQNGTMSPKDIAKLEKKAKTKADKKAKSVGKMLSEAKKADIAARAAREPPLPPRVKTPEQIEKEAKKAAKAEKKAAKAAKKAEKDAKKLEKKEKKLKKTDSMETKTKETLDPDRVVSDVEQCVINETVTLSNDLLGMCHVDFKRLLKPGQRKTVWLRLEGGPGDQKRAAAGEMDLEDPDKDPNERVYADWENDQDSGEPEIEVEIEWSVYEDVSFAKPGDSHPGDSHPDEPDSADTTIGTVATNDAGIAVGSLHVEVVKCSDLQKPRVGSVYKTRMSGERVTPKVDIYVSNQQASTQTSRGTEPTFKEHFDFPGITALDELVVRVAHPGRKSMSTKIGMFNVKDKFMGSVVVPLNGVVKSGAIAGTYALGGVKHGDVTLNLNYRVERKYASSSD